MTHSTTVVLLTLAHAFSLQAQEPSARTDDACEPALRGVTTRCQWIDVGGRYRVRSIVTRPTAAPAGRLPAVLFVQWLSCDPVAVVPEANDGWNNVLRDLIQASGMVVARTEKPGIGGSGGPACSSLGYDEELEVHRQALRELERSPGVHADSVFIFGASMGGTMAPLLAAEGGVRGVIVAGTTGSTWVEHMIALDRRVMALRGMPADSIHALMPQHIRFHAQYLGEQRLPSSIIAAWPEARTVWRRMIGTDSALRLHYGRPLAFHQEAQRQNWAHAWSRVSAPVLIIHGAYDWIMADFEQDAITRARPRMERETRYIDVPRMGHDFLIYPSPADSFRGEHGRFDAAISREILGWLRERRSQ